MSEPPGVARVAGERAAHNTAVLMGAEIIGRLAWFAVFAGLGRTQGEAEVGIFVFAAALVQIAMLAVDLGLDRYLIRNVAKQHEQRHALLSDIVLVKLVLAVPAALVLALLTKVLGYGGATEQTIYLLTIAFVLEGLGRTVFAVLTAFEEGGPIAITAVVQRLLAAALGLTALLLGYGVVAVALCYLIGAATGAALATALMFRSVGVPRWEPDRRRWLTHARASLPFAAEDVFMVLLFKVDAVILALMTTEAIVGLYGAAYRIFEATLVVPYALVRAFAAMYVYLERDSQPTIEAAFSRSIKLALSGLVPVSVCFGLLAEPILTVTFGDDFAGAAGPLRLLAPGVAMLGVVSLSCALISSRRDPKIVMYLAGATAVLNLALNLILIPRYEASGAAGAMLISEICFSTVALAIAARVVGGLEWVRVLAGPLGAALAMAGLILPLTGTPLLALALGGIAYLATLYAIERATSPADVRFAVDLVVGRFRPRRSPA